MNYKERKVYTNLLLIQGAYFSILGVFVLCFYGVGLLNVQSLDKQLFFSTKLIGGFILTFGVTLLLSSRKFRQNRSTYFMGFFGSLTLLLHHSFYVYHFDSSLYLGAGLMIQLGFVLVWTWLSYWKWIEDKFSDL